MHVTSIKKEIRDDEAVSLESRAKLESSISRDRRQDKNQQQRRRGWIGRRDKSESEGWKQEKEEGFRAKRQVKNYMKFLSFWFPFSLLKENEKNATQKTLAIAVEEKNHPKHFCVWFIDQARISICSWTEWAKGKKIPDLDDEQEGEKKVEKVQKTRRWEEKSSQENKSEDSWCKKRTDCNHTIHHHFSLPSSPSLLWINCSSRVCVYWNWKRERTDAWSLISRVCIWQSTLDLHPSHSCRESLIFSPLLSSSLPDFRSFFLCQHRCNCCAKQLCKCPVFFFLHNWDTRLLRECKTLRI